MPKSVRVIERINFVLIGSIKPLYFMKHFIDEGLILYVNVYRRQKQEKSLKITICFQKMKTVYSGIF